MRSYWSPPDAGEHQLRDLVRDTAVGWRVRSIDNDALLRALSRRELPAGAPTPAGVDLPPMSESQAADLLSWLVAEGVPVVSYGPVGSGLESAYLALSQERR
jgi:ABC-2 type transport system ATP-binding protein